MNKQRILISGFVALTLLLLGVFLWWHLDLGLHRYIDADEFAHLHWASHVAMGKLPYRDFFSFFPPGFWWVLTPVFWIWHGSTVVIAARVVEFIIFSLLCVVLACLFRMLRRSWIFLVAPVVLAFLPLPFDKFIEVRPDTIATLSILAGMVLQIIAQRSASKTRFAWSGWIAGCLYGISLFILPKAILQVVFALFVAAVSQKRNGMRVAGGLLIVSVAFGAWVLTLGKFDLILYSLIKLPLEANQISKFFIMQPDLFFYPNTIFYGTGGYTQGLIVNHVLWIIGLGMGLYRLLTAFSHPKESGFWEELLVSGSFFILVISYVQLVPLKHAQYLIPIAVFISFYVADGVFLLWQKLSRRSVGILLFSVCFLSGGLLLYQTMALVNGPKLLWTNRETFDSMDKIFTTIPFATPVLDLEGRTLYYPDPYYVCCLPFGQFSGFLSHPLPSLADALETQKTPYIFDSELHRIDTLLPEDRSYILSHYRASSDISGLFVRTQ